MNGELFSVDSIKGLGKKYAAILNESGIYSVKDLFFSYPYRYDAFVPTDIFHITDYNHACFVGSVISSISYQFHRSNLNSLSFNILVNKEVIKVIIFNRKYLQSLLTPNTKVMVYGKYNYFKK